MESFVAKVLDLAAAEVGVRETAPNRGERVDEYHRYAGRDPASADSWCAQFVWWVLGHAAADLGQPSPIRFSSSVLRLWERNSDRQTAIPRPGDVFCIEHDDGKGHCGIVVAGTAGPPWIAAPDGTLETIEGNTNGGGSRNGDGVYRRARNVKEINLGFLRPGLEHERPGIA